MRPLLATLISMVCDATAISFVLTSMAICDIDAGMVQGDRWMRGALSQEGRTDIRAVDDHNMLNNASDSEIGSARLARLP